jgi:hypothetical protein
MLRGFQKLFGEDSMDLVGLRFGAAREGRVDPEVKSQSEHGES